MASIPAAHSARTRCVECGHEFAASSRWNEATPCPCCGHLASRSRDWILRSLELLGVGALSALWAYWWF